MIYNTASMHQLLLNGSSTLSTSEVTGTEYDESGAMLYIIVVLTIYGSSIILFIGYSVRSSANTKQGQIDRAVERYVLDKYSDYTKRQVSSQLQSG